MLIYEEIGIKIRLAREALGMAQGDLADRAGVSRQTVWRIESGQCASVAFDSVVQVLTAVGYGVYLDQGIAAPPNNVQPDDIERLYRTQILGEGGDGA